MLITKKSKKMRTNLNKCRVENCLSLPGRNLIFTCNHTINMPRLDGLKFHPGKPESCNHHLKPESIQYTYRKMSTDVFGQKYLEVYLRLHRTHGGDCVWMKPIKIIQKFCFFFLSSLQGNMCACYLNWDYKYRRF